MEKGRKRWPEIDQRGGSRPRPTRVIGKAGKWWIRGFLGMLNFVRSFISNLAGTITPLVANPDEERGH